MIQQRISLKTFNDQVPKYDILEVVVNQMVINEKCSIEDIKGKIVDHISEHTRIQQDDYENIGEALSIAEDMINFIIDWLDASETSYTRIRNYIKKYHSWNGYNKLLMDDYVKFLLGEDRPKLIAEGREIFVSEITDLWE